WSAEMTNKKTLPVFLFASSFRMPTPVAVALFALFLALFYASPWQTGAWAALAAWGAVAVLRPDVAICVVAATIPFVFQPRELGQWHFAPAEATLLLSFGAVVVRRVLGWPGAAAADSRLQPQTAPPVHATIPLEQVSILGSLAERLLVRWRLWQARDGFGGQA